MYPPVFGTQQNGTALRQRCCEQRGGSPGTRNHGREASSTTRLMSRRPMPRSRAASVTMTGSTSALVPWSSRPVRPTTLPWTRPPRIRSAVTRRGSHQSRSRVVSTDRRVPIDTSVVLRQLGPQSSTSTVVALGVVANDELRRGWRVSLLRNRRRPMFARRSVEDNLGSVAHQARPICRASSGAGHVGKPGQPTRQVTFRQPSSLSCSIPPRLPAGRTRCRRSRKPS